MDERRAGLERWLCRQLDVTDPQLHAASADAGFRRYFRVAGTSPTRIAVDAPPDTEKNAEFVNLARRFGALGLHVPEVLAADLEQGYLLIGDLGHRSYLDALTTDTVDRLYGDALGALLTLQATGPVGADMPRYDAPMLRRELDTFREWYLDAHLGLSRESATEAVIDDAFTLLIDNALQQPQVCVHRDYHSRNLMITADNNPGIIDFQDAVVGPLTYDLVSLLKDCYIDWPRQQIEEWALGYYELAIHSGVLPAEAADEQRFLRWFDLMGMQRHLKATGIFARLYRRDGKDGYLGDIPRTLGYVQEVTARFPELAGFSRWLQQDVVPRL